MSWLARVAAALISDGTALDRTENAIADGMPQQTISLRAALAAQRGERWGCWLCAFLSVAVQRGHCAKQLAGQPMTGWNYLRAAALLTGIPSLAAFAVLEAARGLWTLLTHL